MNKDILYTSIFKDCLSKKIEELNLNVKPRFGINKELKDFLNALYSNKLDEYIPINPLLKIDFSHSSFNRRLLPNTIPKTVTEIIFSNDFNEPLDENVLPHGLTYLNLGKRFNHTIEYLPHSITHLILSTNFNKKIRILPKNLVFLNLGYDFIQSLDVNVLPYGLLTLIFSIKYNEIINKDVIPDTVKHLNLGFYFNKPLDGCIPKNVSYLQFSYFFNKELKIGDLPDSIIHLVFGSLFNQELKPNVLPKYLNKLVFGKEFNQNIDYYVLPLGLKYLTFGYKFNNFIRNGVIPNTVIYLTFGYYFSNTNLEKKSIPDSVKYLLFYSEYDTYEIYFPKNLKFILLGGSDEYSLKNIDQTKYIGCYMYFHDRSTDLSSIIDNNFYIKIVIDDVKYKIHISHLEKIIEKVERNLFMSTIFKELTEKLYHPSRLERYLEKYDIDINDE